jgi:hypothetical protein
MMKTLKKMASAYVILQNCICLKFNAVSITDSWKGNVLYQSTNALDVEIK